MTDMQEDIKDAVATGGAAAQETVGAVKKKGGWSLPFTLLGVLLAACLCPVGDVDGDGGIDIAGKWVMLKVMTNQVQSEQGSKPIPPDMDKLGPKPENPPLAGA